ncbi:hypothetical protein SLS53_001318 [Cytospora paraplurivora]|uniref:Cyanovirin-N domain-containing protein n=1 Tax=Cytospora paraplurivora TaxID=2898453 RepID=A0AAN9UJE7_9PEZI
MMAQADLSCTGGSGRYSEWCGTCGEVDSRIFACQCWTGTYHGDGQPVYQYTEFDLDTIVGNDFGYLRCFDNIAPKSYGCV